MTLWLDTHSYSRDSLNLTSVTISPCDSNGSTQSDTDYITNSETPSPTDSDSPATPRLELSEDASPFSEDFAELFEGLGMHMNAHIPISKAGMSESGRSGMMTSPNDSLSDSPVDWTNEDLGGTMFLRGTSQRRQSVLATIQETSESLSASPILPTASLSDFTFNLQPVSPNLSLGSGSSDTLSSARCVCIKRDTNKKYIIKRIRLSPSSSGSSSPSASQPPSLPCIPTLPTLSSIPSLPTVPTLSHPHPQSPSLELTILQSLTALSTPFVERLHWEWVERESLYFVVDHHPNGSLEDHVKQYGAMGGLRAGFYGAELASALFHLHTAGIVHRSLDPSNIVFDEEGHLVVADFKCAEFFERDPGGRGMEHVPMHADVNPAEGFEQSRNTASNGPTAEQRKLRHTGPPSRFVYQAPEVLLNWKADSKADCWSFGMVVYYMLFACHPFASGAPSSSGLGSSALEEPGSARYSSAPTSSTRLGPEAAYLYHRILKTAITHDSEQLRLISPDARDLIVRCVERNADVRWSIDKIRKHGFFRLVDWGRVGERGVKVPSFVPSSGVSPVVMMAHHSRGSASGSGFGSSASLNATGLGHHPSSSSLSGHQRNRSTTLSGSAPPVLPALSKPSGRITIPSIVTEEDDDAEREGEEKDMESLGPDEEETGAADAQDTKESDAKERMSRFWDNLDREERGSVVTVSNASMEFGEVRRVSASGATPEPKVDDPLAGKPAAAKGKVGGGGTGGLKLVQKLRKHRSAIQSSSATSFALKPSRKMALFGNLSSASLAVAGRARAGSVGQFGQLSGASCGQQLPIGGFGKLGPARFGLRRKAKSQVLSRERGHEHEQDFSSGGPGNEYEGSESDVKKEVKWDLPLGIHQMGSGIGFTFDPMLAQVGSSGHTSHTGHASANATVESFGACCGGAGQHHHSVSGFECASANASGAGGGAQDTSASSTGYGGVYDAPSESALASKVSVCSAVVPTNCFRVGVGMALPHGGTMAPKRGKHQRMGGVVGFIGRGEKGVGKEKRAELGKGVGKNGEDDDRTGNCEVSGHVNGERQGEKTPIAPILISNPNPTLEFDPRSPTLGGRDSVAEALHHVAFGSSAPGPLVVGSAAHAPQLAVGPSTSGSLANGSTSSMSLALGSAGTPSVLALRSSPSMVGLRSSPAMLGLRSSPPASLTPTQQMLRSIPSSDTWLGSKDSVDLREIGVNVGMPTSRSGDFGVPTPRPIDGIPTPRPMDVGAPTPRPRQEVGNGTFLRDMVRTPSWIFSPPDCIPSPMKLVNAEREHDEDDDEDFGEVVLRGGNTSATRSGFADLVQAVNEEGLRRVLQGVDEPLSPATLVGSAAGGSSVRFAHGFSDLRDSEGYSYLETTRPADAPMSPLCHCYQPCRNRFCFYESGKGQDQQAYTQRNTVEDSFRSLGEGGKSLYSDNDHIYFGQLRDVSLDIPTIPDTSCVLAGEEQEMAARRYYSSAGGTDYTRSSRTPGYDLRLKGPVDDDDDADADASLSVLAPNETLRLVPPSLVSSTSLLRYEFESAMSAPSVSTASLGCLEGFEEF